MTENLKTYLFKVEMSCEGCANAISNVLNKHKDKGINSFEVNLETTTVTITSSLSVEEVTEILNKTKKKITFIEEKKK